MNGKIAINFLIPLSDLIHFNFHTMTRWKVISKRSKQIYHIKIKYNIFFTKNI